MPTRHRFALVAAAAWVVSLGLASPARAVVPETATAPKAAAAPACQIASPESFSGAMFVNNQIVNGRWTYATGIACTSNLGDIALYQELDFNGTKVDSRSRPFTGVARPYDAIAAFVHCAVCNGHWHFVWGQALKAPSGFTFTNPIAGCVVVANGAYQLCVQTKDVTL
ncbi:MAG: hypothetical protein M3083_11275 [Actinomycetota bacterium]|nr:hypothetical protein [Actinomycetota bacterium]